MRSCNETAVDDALLRWFKAKRSQNASITGPILQAKADEFAKQLKLENFKCTTGWIQRFRKRHNIVCGTVSGEAASVPEGICENWLSTVWPNLRRGYSDEEIFNAD